MGGIRLVRVTVIMLQSGRFLTELSYPPRVPKKPENSSPWRRKQDESPRRIGTMTLLPVWVLQQPNQHAASTYRANYTSRNRLLIESGLSVPPGLLAPQLDSKADDMTKGRADHQ